MIAQEVSMKETVSAYEAAKFLGCSYPHLIHLIRKNKLEATKVRKQWFVKKDSLRHIKETQVVTPRPRLNQVRKTNEAVVDNNFIDVTFRLPIEKYEELKEKLNACPADILKVA